MKLLINDKSGGSQMPVLRTRDGGLRIPFDFESEKEPSELSPGQAVTAMLCCARQGWEWEIVA